MKVRRVLPALFASVLAVTSFGMLTGAGVASASAAGRGPSVCSGTLKSPGVLTGTHRNVVVRGVCFVNAGRAQVLGNLVVAPRGVLLAAFALNDRTHKGRSSLAVRGNLTVSRGGALLLGCEAAHFACIDDPNQKHPTLSSHSSVGGDLFVNRALGAVVHLSTIGGSVQQIGGGGGRTCTPSGIFAQFKSPVYSDYEDNAIGAELLVTNVQSCWFGALRNHVGHSIVAVSNKMADPDAMEVNSNRIARRIACFGNSPAVQFGDSRGTPNLVRGVASGQCGFGVRKPNPAPNGPLQHISVHA